MAIVIRGLTPLLQVFDMPASIVFYCDVLGFQIVSTDRKPLPHNDWVMLELAGVQVMLNTAYERDRRPPAPDPRRIEAHRDTCLYFGCPDLDGAYAHLRSKGVDLAQPAIAPYGMKQLYLFDPDGYNVCFQWPAGESQEEAPETS